MIGEPSVDGQKALERVAEAAGADWLILQPPAVKGVPEREIVRFFGAVADAASLPIAVQSNPVNMDVWLSNPSLLTLHRNHPGVDPLQPSPLKRLGGAVAGSPARGADVRRQLGAGTLGRGSEGTVAAV